MAIIKKLDKKSGTVYVYDSVSYWDKEKQQGRSNRTLIGKIDPLTGNVIPTKGRGRRSKKDEQSTLTFQTSLSSPSSTVSDDKADQEERFRKAVEERDIVIAALRKEIENLSKEKRDLISRLQRIVNEFAQ